MYARPSSSLEETQIDPSTLYELLKLQQEFPVVHPSLPTVSASSPTHYIGTSLFEKPEAKTQGTELSITAAWKFPVATQKSLTGAQVLYNQELALDLLYSLNPSADNFELETIIKFKKFENITDIYIEEGEQFINIRVFINLESYDYNLMNNIFNDAEFPLKDKFEKDKLFNFQYIYKKAIQSEFIDYLGRRVFYRL